MEETRRSYSVAEAQPVLGQGSHEASNHPGKPQERKKAPRRLSILSQIEQVAQEVQQSPARSSGQLLPTSPSSVRSPRSMIASTPIPEHESLTLCSTKTPPRSGQGHDDSGPPLPEALAAVLQCDPLHKLSSSERSLIWRHRRICRYFEKVCPASGTRLLL